MSEITPTLTYEMTDNTEKYLLIIDTEKDIEGNTRYELLKGCKLIARGTAASQTLYDLYFERYSPKVKLQKFLDLEEVNKINTQQRAWKVHPYTCGGSGTIPECKRAKREGDEYESDGVLIATQTGWVCPCGKERQDYVGSILL